MHFNLPWSKLSMYTSRPTHSVEDRHGERCCMCGMCVWSAKGLPDEERHSAVVVAAVAAVAAMTAAKGKVVSKHPWAPMLTVRQHFLIQNEHVQFSERNENLFQTLPTINPIVGFMHTQSSPFLLCTNHAPPLTPIHSASGSRHWSPFECTMVRTPDAGESGGKTAIDYIEECFCFNMSFLLCLKCFCNWKLVLVISFELDHPNLLIYQSSLICCSHTIHACTVSALLVRNFKYLGELSYLLVNFLEHTRT